MSIDLSGSFKQFSVLDKMQKGSASFLAGSVLVPDCKMKLFFFFHVKFSSSILTLKDWLDLQRLREEMSKHASMVKYRCKLNTVVMSSVHFPVLFP